MLAERTGLAHVPRAAVSLASETLRAPSRASRRGGTLIERKKARRIGPFFLMLAERTGLEPATPGVTGRYSNQLNYRSVYSDRCFTCKTSETDWWALRGSNSRPNPCKGSALPTELSARFRVFLADVCHHVRRGPNHSVSLRKPARVFRKKVNRDVTHHVLIYNKLLYGCVSRFVFLA